MKAIIYLAVTLLFLFVAKSCESGEVTGSVTVEGRLFLHSPAYSGQKHNDFSFSFEAEYYQELPAGSNITISPFARLDSADSERTHFDFREFNFFYHHGSLELTTGISRTFWGATEFVHLVDIINQTDLVEGLDGEDKLGQPMIHLSIVKQWGVIDGFVLPYFRERTFPGENGRLRGERVVDTSRTKYESGAEKHHIDLAVRYSHAFGNCDFGLYHFSGTNREPTLVLDTTDVDDSVLIPYYQQIQQTGFDLQLVQGEWLWKSEFLYRIGQGRDFAATVLGFEYTMYGILKSSTDLGIIGEYVFNDRDETIPTSYNNDIILGLRWTLNDFDDTQFLVGMIKDLDDSSIIISLEGNRRIRNAIKLQLTGALSKQIDSDDQIATLQNDDFIKIEAIVYF